MKTYAFCFVAMVCSCLQISYAQEEIQLTKKDSIIKSSSMFGVGFNFVDDSGDAFKDVTTVKDQWNYVPFPSRLSIGKYFGNGIGLEAIATYNKYKEGNIIDGVINPEDKDYFGFDARVSYDLNKLVGQTGWFDPYLGVGAGYTDANDVARGTYNAVVGFRTWFSDRWGLDFSSSGKWSFGNEASNHIQHAVGVLYQFNIEKELSKKGMEKLALINEIEQEKQRVADSIAAAQEAEEAARLLAERLAREKEQAELAAAEKAKLDAENSRKQGIIDAIEALGHVYFDLNSSYLNADSKAVLDQLAVLLKNTPSLALKVSSHTDSRGTDAYNQWLAERRAKRTKDYLVSIGVAAERLEALGMGEQVLTNHCKNKVPCSAKEHRQNRRSEFEILNY